jgi:hypothetical protein
MTKKEFKRRWESTENGGGITYDIVADCATEWGIIAPRTMDMETVLYLVLKAAKTVDAEEFAPEE